LVTDKGAVEGPIAVVNVQVAKTRLGLNGSRGVQEQGQGCNREEEALHGILLSCWSPR
jgi:hypothetical protein